jgi:hypothetical protein
MATKKSSTRSPRSAKATTAKSKGRDSGASKPAAPQGGSGSAATLDEQALWQMADKLRNNMDAAEYKHVVLGLIFLKYISDAFEEKHEALEAEKDAGADPEDPDEYRAEGIFWVPKEARWSHLQSQAKQPTIGTLVDDAMFAIERDDTTLRGVLPKDFARPQLDKQRLGDTTGSSRISSKRRDRSARRSCHPGTITTAGRRAAPRHRSWSPSFVATQVRA